MYPEGDVGRFLLLEQAHSLTTQVLREDRLLVFSPNSYRSSHPLLYLSSFK